MNRLLPLLVLLGAVVLAACGGGGDGADGAPVSPPSPTNDARAPRSDRATTLDRDALPNAVPLNQLFPAEIVDAQPQPGGTPIRVAISAGPTDQEQVLGGVVGVGGRLRSPALVADEVGFVDAFQVVYSGEASLDARDGTLVPRITVIDLIRLTDSVGAGRLLSIQRSQADGSGRTRLAVPDELPPEAYIVDRISSASPTEDRPGYSLVEVPRFAQSFLDTGRLTAIGLTQQAGNLVIRTLVFGATPTALDEAIAQSAAVADRAAAARDGNVLASLDVPFRSFSTESVLDRLPLSVDGYDQLAVDVVLGAAFGTATALQYVGVGGESVLLLVLPISTAVDAAFLDFLLQQPGILAAIFGQPGTAVEIVDIEPFDPPTEDIAVAERWQVVVRGTAVANELMALRRGAAWSVIQGLSFDQERTPVGTIAQLVVRAMDEAAGVVP